MMCLLVLPTLEKELWQLEKELWQSTTMSRRRWQMVLPTLEKELWQSEETRLAGL